MHAGQVVLVGLHGVRDVGVTEAFADDFHWDPVLDQQAAVIGSEILPMEVIERQIPSIGLSL